MGFFKARRGVGTSYSKPRDGDIRVLAITTYRGVKYQVQSYGEVFSHWFWEMTFKTQGEAVEFAEALRRERGFVERSEVVWP